jgi:ribokinase
VTRPVVFIGDVNVDIVAMAAGALRRGSDMDSEVSLVGGGSAANMAAWSAALGHDAHLVAIVGDDHLGVTAMETLRAAGVTLHIRMASERTGTCVVIVEPDGERTMLPDPAANLLLQPSDIPTQVLTEAGALVLSGYSLLRAGPRPAALHALATARQAGIATFIDAASSGPLLDVGAEVFLDWAHGHGLLLNAMEAQALSPGHSDDPRDIARDLSRRHPVVALKRGAQGALVAIDGEVAAEAEAPPVTVVDTTGAGDAFAAGMTGSFTSTSDPSAWLEAGVAAAARAVARRGARPN